MPFAPDRSEIPNAPDWRWTTASEMVRQNDPPDRDDDRDLIRAYRFLTRRKDRTPSERRRLQKDYPDIFAAHALYRDLTSERWLIEAGLLTDTPFQELAEYVAQSVFAIDTYASMFFDVKAKLKARGWILTRVLMPPRLDGQPTDVDFMLKAIAYFSGWKTLCEYVEARQLSPATRNYLMGDYRDQVLRRGWEAAHLARINKFNVVEVMEMPLKMLALDLQQGNVSESEMVTRLNQVFGGCRIGVADPVPMIDEPRPKALVLTVTPTVKEKAE